MEQLSFNFDVVAEEAPPAPTVTSGPTVPLSKEVWQQKYANGTETHAEAMARIAKALGDSEEHTAKFQEILSEMRFLPAGRIQAGAGSPKRVTYLNCFLSGEIFDSMDSIMDAAKEAAETMRMGGGIGFNFGRIRPRGDLIKSLDSRASGPISFMGIFNAVCQTIASAGHRRGAMMGTLPCSHPDIFEFVRAKRNEESLRGFNISVLCTDEFMEAVKADGDYNLTFEGKVYRTIRARELWDEIMMSTWDWAEPGILFIDRINRENNVSYAHEIMGVNPCVTGDTRLATSRGLVTVKELFDSQEQLSVVADKRILNSGLGVEFRDAVPVFQTSEMAKVYKVTTKAGYSIRATDWHGFFVAGREKEITRLKDLQVGQKLLIQSGEGGFGLQGYPELGRVLGFITGDGHISGEIPKATIGFWGLDTEYADSLAQDVEVILKRETNSHKKVSPYATIARKYRGIGSTVLARVLARYGFTKETKLKVPDVIWKGNRETVVAYLQGLFETDGTINRCVDTCSVRLSSSHRSLLEEVQILLSNFGVYSTISSRRKPGYRNMPKNDGTGEMKAYFCKENFELIIDGSSREIFMEEIGFYGLRKQEKYLDWKVGKALYKKQPFTSEISSIEEDGYEPVYDTTQPDMNTVIFNGLVTSQCGEVPLQPYGACLLGSFNMVKYLNEEAKEFDWHTLIQDISTVVRAMDNVNDVSPFPLPAQKEEARKYRRIGLGVTGMANALEFLGHSYASDSYLTEQDKILETLCNAAYQASAYLAKEKGVFPRFDKEKFLNSPFVQRLAEPTKALIREYGVRNSHLTSLAPTGTISLTADNVSSGIEPVFSHSYTRTIQTFDGPVVEAVKDYAYAKWGIKGRTSGECPVEDHVAVLARAQRFVDQAVSKTCNVGNRVTFDEFKDVYMLAYEKGCKGITTFRAAGKRYGILNETTKKDDKPEQEATLDVAPAAEACYYDPSTGKKSCE